MHLARLQPGHFLGQLGEPFGDARRAQDLGHRLGLLVGQVQHRPGLVGILARVDDDVEVAAAPRDDADAVALVVGELVAKADPGQQHLLDVHTSILTGRFRRRRPR
ncbi:hypothetical protein D522_19301 [Mycobacterium avium subsp. paratuberculosis S5]|nr:hypothetical protein D522_19301 [Mycobacterium avium subsp. paratuberculosis S5]